jgi:hypothetical protein
MFGLSKVDEELKRGVGLSMDQVQGFLRTGGDASESKFMECCRWLWKVNGAELVEPFVNAAFNLLPAKSRCVLFQRMLTIVYVAQDAALTDQRQSPADDPVDPA